MSEIVCITVSFLSRLRWDTIVFLSGVPVPYDGTVFHDTEMSVPDIEDTCWGRGRRREVGGGTECGGFTAGLFRVVLSVVTERFLRACF